MFHWLSDLRNRIDYPLRQLFRFHRSGLHFPAEAKQNLFDHLPADQRKRAEALARRLMLDYHLQEYARQSTRQHYREALYYLDLLTTALSAIDAQLPTTVAALDVGASHWFYVQTYAAALRWYAKPGTARTFSLDGYERDAYRIYANLFSRYDHAQAHLSGLKQARYFPYAFAANPEHYDLATMLFPFVLINDHLEWGLPRPDFDPQLLLGDVWRSLKPGGLLIIANQGQEEHRLQGDYLRNLGIVPQVAQPFDSPLFSYDIPRFLYAARKPA